MLEPRSATESGKDFPYRSRTVCYLEVAGDGAVRWSNNGQEVYHRALSSSSRFYAVWPGEWSSHLFAIDDVAELGRGLGIVPDQDRTGLAAHTHRVRWANSPYGTTGSGWVSIDVWLDCGCEIQDIKAFAAQMREQRGWTVATSSGWGHHGSHGGQLTYSIRVLRSTLR